MYELQVSYDLPEENDDHGNPMNISTEENATMLTDSDKNVEPVEMDLDTEDDGNSQQGDGAGATEEPKESENESKDKTEGRQKKISTSEIFFLCLFLSNY